jgi:hypothetical protein
MYSAELGMVRRNYCFRNCLLKRTASRKPLDTAGCFLQDDEWEEASDDEDDDVSEPSSATPAAFTGNGRSSVFKPIEDFANLLSEDFAEGSYTEDPDAKSDPINSINVSEYAVKYLKELARRDEAGFVACCQGLNRTQQEAVQAALHNSI